MAPVSLSINHDTCIKCRRCVRVCPSGIFYQETPGAEISLRNVHYCIICGHCPAVCPTDSIIHGNFPEEKVHKIDAELLPTPKSLMHLIKARRSNRGFSKKPVPVALLDQTLEAAHRAPTASNRQEVEYTLITSPDKLQMVIDYTMSEFQKLIKKANNPLIKRFIRPSLTLQLRRMERIQKEYAKGNDPILRNATALILIHTPTSNRFGQDDANLAYQNGSLMAESLGVAQFYTGYVCTAIRKDKKNKLANMLGIEGTIHAGMALGMPDFTYSNYIDRKDIKVNRYI